MEAIEITKKYTNEEVRKEILEHVDHTLVTLRDLVACANNLPSCFKLRVVNLAHVKDNINALRRELYQADRSFEQITEYIDTVHQKISEASSGELPATPSPELEKSRRDE
jgi:hypothetical protein